MRICDWANEVSTNHIGVHGSSLVTVEQLRLDAALAYEKRQYTEAYRIYNQIVNQYPKKGTHIIEWLLCFIKTCRLRLI